MSDRHVILLQNLADDMCNRFGLAGYDVEAACGLQPLTGSTKTFAEPYPGSFVGAPGGVGANLSPAKPVLATPCYYKKDETGPGLLHWNVRALRAGYFANASLIRV